MTAIISRSGLLRPGRAEHQVVIDGDKGFELRHVEGIGLEHIRYEAEPFPAFAEIGRHRFRRALPPAATARSRRYRRPRPRPSGSGARATVAGALFPPGLAERTRRRRHAPCAPGAGGRRGVFLVPPFSCRSRCSCSLPVLITCDPPRPIPQPSLFEWPTKSGERRMRASTVAGNSERPETQDSGPGIRTR